MTSADSQARDTAPMVRHRRTVRKVAAGSVLLFITIGGCAVKSPPPAHQLVQIPTREQFTQAQPDNSGELVAQGWIDSFGDPQLSALVNEAVSNNPDLQAAAARIEQARAIADRTGARLSPQLQGNAGAAATGAGDRRFSEPNFQLGISASWELDVWGRIRQDQAAAVMDEQVARADELFARYSLAASTADAWFTANAAKIQLDIFDEALKTQTRIADIVRSKFNAGTASQMDADIADADLARANDAYQASLAAYRDAIRALELLLGR
jgi:multidrug efflux system outer membrane protein